MTAQNTPAAAPSYITHPPHRNGNPNKSQWTITPDAELACFALSGNEAWLLLEVGIGWGLHLEVDGTGTANVSYLGENAARNRVLFLAKFVGTSGQWHGYPCDPQAKAQDIPKPAILESWLAKKLLPAAKIRRILKGQPCSL